MGKESEIIEYGQEVEFDCTLMGLSAIEQKGGYLAVKIKIPISTGDAAGAATLAGIFTTHLGNIAKGRLKFSSVKQDRAPKDDQPDLAGLEDE